MRDRTNKQQFEPPGQLALLSRQSMTKTNLLCDGCGHEFDPLTLHPPLLKVPERGWFCPACSDASAAASAVVNACVGCNSRSRTGGSAVNHVHPKSGYAGDVVLCEVCRNLQASHVPCEQSLVTATVSNESNIVLPVTAGRKRNGVCGVSASHDNPKKPKICFSGPPVTDGNSVVIQPTGHHASRNASVEDNAGPSLHIPRPITLMASSVGLEKDELKPISNGWSFANLTLIIANPNDKYLFETIFDAGETTIMIICDICFGEFKMSDVIGTGRANAVPARPWFCKPCLRALKRGRKKRPRFSKQMVTEMQVHGRLLRATSAKVSDLDAVKRLKIPLNSLEERRQMYELVGKSVGVFLQWDEQWVMGRVMAFHATHPAMHHTIRCDDGVVMSLPLYAFPLVIGTCTILYVKVPALQNQWWPAQVLRLNALARKVLLPSNVEATEADANFRFVRIFTNTGGHVEMTPYVSCWVPKYLCRSMKRFNPRFSSVIGTTKTSENAEGLFQESVRRAQKEAQLETECLDHVFQTLLAVFRRALATSAPGKSDVRRRYDEIVESMVGKIIVVTSSGSCNLIPGTFAVKRFDSNAKKHVISPHGDTVNADEGNVEIVVDLLQCAGDGIVYHFNDTRAFSELAILLELSGFGVGRGISGDFHSKELLERAIIEDSGMLRDSADAARKRNKDRMMNPCSHCLIGPDERRNDIDTYSAVRSRDHAEELIVCAKCNRRFHKTCCDPPHAPISLVHPDDGQVLATDLSIPFVCSDCTVCSGCLMKNFEEPLQTEPLCISEKTMLNGEEECRTRWSQWRLPLQAVSLCSKCIPYYKANQYCSVCNVVYNDAQLVTSIKMLACSTCHHWIHADCEPDPHPAFHVFNSTDDFTLDVMTDVFGNPPDAVADFQHSITTANHETDTKLTLNAKSLGDSHIASDHETQLNALNSASKDDTATKSAKQVEENVARLLQFRAEYDPRVLHNYECLTCRKIRMLHILYRLDVEDKLDLFKEPVTEAIAPTYFDIIKSPMDLSTMRQKVIEGEYGSVNFRGFRDDFELMCLNAVTFNSKERDFFIWREAWRFYGQGQRIFRQIAPKARMKHRGGRFYDALIVAAKRQLPNNSALACKTQSNRDSFENGEDCCGNEDDDDLDDDEDGDNGSDPGPDAFSGGAKNREIVGMPKRSACKYVSDAASVHKSNGSSILLNSTRQSIQSGFVTDVAPSSTANGTTSAAITALAEHLADPNDLLVFQTKLRVSNFISRIPLFQIAQTRASAHTSSWLDMCIVCGSAGLQGDFIFCIDCGEGFHSFCIPGMRAARMEGCKQLHPCWRCLNCKICQICGRSGTVCVPDDWRSRVVATAGNVDILLPATRVTGVAMDLTHELSGNDSLVLCAHCDRGYHRLCLVPSIKLPTAFNKNDDSREVPTIYCSSCVACTNCKVDSGGSIESLKSGETKNDHAMALERTYSYERSKCLHCHSFKESEEEAQKGRIRLLAEVWNAAARIRKRDADKCPLCRRKWNAEFEELMQCDACEHWVHPFCDELLKAEPQRYHTLVSNPDAVYVCAACRPQERKHIADRFFSDADSWRCQILLADIQRRRLQCNSGWKETQMQLEQVEHWKRLADYTPVYLYVLRLGEECLRDFAYQSLSFQSDWYRATKQQELDKRGVSLPEWILFKASRYMRFKRYVRGPRAATRRREHKLESCYAKQAVDVNTHKNAGAICTIVSEAASCAAFLACVHVLYGWRPLPEVVIHMLSRDEESGAGVKHRKLDMSLLRRAQAGEYAHVEEAESRLKLEKEIAAIKEQHGRRIAMGRLTDKSSVEPTTRDFGNRASDPATLTATPSSGETNSSTASHNDGMSKVAGSAQCTTEVNTHVVAPASHGQAPEAPLSASSSRDSSGMMSCTASATPLRGWLTTCVEEANGGVSPETSTTVVFEDNRFCALCFIVGDNTACGRLLYTDFETWVHVNCALWSMEVYEGESGVLHNCSKAKHRSRLIRCDGCGLMGATIGCTIPRCTTHYHFPCALDAGVAFLPNGETCCPIAVHLDSVARKLKAMNGGSLASAAMVYGAESNVEVDSPVCSGKEKTSAIKDDETSATIVGASHIEDSELPRSAEEERKGYENPRDASSSTLLGEGAREANALLVTDDSASSNTMAMFTGEMEEENVLDKTRSDDASRKAQQDKLKSNHGSTEAKPPKYAQHVLPVINPRTEPRRCLVSDPPLLTAWDLKKKKRAELKRGIKPRPICYRVGALTVHSLGHIFVGNGSFHSRTAIYPLGFRSTRIFWSTRNLGTRCLYECVISSTEIEDRHARQTRAMEDRAVGSDQIEDSECERPQRKPRAVFKVTASDDKGRPIVAFTPEAALVELRSRVVSLYEEQRDSFASSLHVGQSATVEMEPNLFLKRSSWLSFALRGDFFFGFGLPEIARHIEELPYAATTAINRRSVVKKLRQQQQCQGQSPLAGSAAATWRSGLRKRSFETMEQSAVGAAEVVEAMIEDTEQEQCYEFAHELPSIKAFQAAERVIEQLVQAEQRAHRSSGCARTDGFSGNRLFGTPKKRKKMPRRLVLNKEASNEPAPGAANSGSTGNGTASTGAVAMDIEHLPITMQYRELRRRPFDERMLVRKSSIHGYGLFLKEPVNEGQMIVEYQGQIVCQIVADARERRYEEQGVGSCYMFRLDEKTIIDATRCGNLARFINHSCDPKAFARVVAVEGGEKKIVIFAKRAIAMGDEVTYDYKFPIEDEAIRCDCNATNCIGRMN
uniref:Histone-lysine N-methyltransferase n=1 Tax=Hyaloperonospora arabidopsidis (strain Emoy2) TaxID=559515 RepID=M4B1Q0_HYAAE